MAHNSVQDLAPANTSPTVKGLFKTLWNIGGVKQISITELLTSEDCNVIVVDGSQFYGQYLYPKFDWICGGVIELAEEVRTFVTSFESAGAKLVFFFVEGHLNEGKTDLGSDVWVKQRCESVDYVLQFYGSLSRQKNDIRNLKQARDYYHTPFHAQSVVIHVLRHVLKCEVHMVDSGFRMDKVASYIGKNKCLGLLAEDKMYLFYRGIPRYLSMKNINIPTMSTNLYVTEKLLDHFGIQEKYFYPTIISNLQKREKEILCLKLDKFIEQCHTREEFLLAFYLNVNVDNDECINTKFKHLISEYFMYYFQSNVDYPKRQICGPLQKEALILKIAKELYSEGKMSNRIKYLLDDSAFHNDSILEDFSGLPPSSDVYLSLRRKLYGILYHECKGAENIEIDEWIVSKTGCHCVEVSPLKLESKLESLHPGLVKLWDNVCISDNLDTVKWKLFSETVSPKLDFHLLRSLSSSLVVLTCVLFYLFHELPCIFKHKERFLEPWEVEVFIAQAVMLPKTSVEDLSKNVIKKYNARALNLIAMFAYGCHNLRLLVQVCGNPINEKDVCLLNYFDGKLFHVMYEKAEWRRRADHLCDIESRGIFNQLKQIIFP